MRYLLLLLLLLSSVAATHAQDTPSPLIPLFNGKDFSGWEFFNCTEKDWTIENGVLSTQKGNRPTNRWLVTDGLYDDFELQLEYMIATKDAISTLVFRAVPQDDLAFNGVGIVLREEAPFPKVDAKLKNGAIKFLAPSSRQAGKPNGEWNRLTLRANDRHLRVVLNGITIHDVDLEELLRTNPNHRGLQRTAGVIGLQTLKGEVKFRNVAIRQLNGGTLPGKTTLGLDVGAHIMAIGKVEFTPDGKQLITGSADHTIRVWDVFTGLPVRVIRPPGQGNTRRMALSPNGEHLAVACEYPEGNKLHNVIYILRFKDGQVEHVLKGHKETILGLAYSADGKRLASSAEDHSIRIWNPATGKMEKSLHSPIGWINPEMARNFRTGSLALSPNGDRVAFAHRNKLVIVEVATGTQLAEMTTSWEFRGVVWSRNGKTLATSGPPVFKDNKLVSGGFHLFDTTGKPLPQPEDPKYFHAGDVAFSKDGTRLVMASTNGVYHRGTLLDVQTGKVLSEFVPKKSVIPGYGPPRGGEACALSPDGKLAATVANGEFKPEIFLWSTRDGELIHRLGGRPWIRPRMQAAWTADGKGVGWTSRTISQSLQLDKLELGTPDKDLVGPRLTEGAFTLKPPPEGGKRYLERVVVKDNEVVARLGVPHRSHVPWGMTFVTPRWVAMSGDWGGFFLYDVATQKRIREFKRMEGPILGNQAIPSAASSPGKTPYIASLGADQLLRIWHPERERPLLTLYVNGDDWIIWTEEGYYAATPGGERMIGWVVDSGIDKSPSFYPAERFRKKLYRPDVIKRILDKGSVEEALKAADTALGVKMEKPVELRKMLPPKATIQLVGKTGQKVKVKVTATAEDGQPIKVLRLMLDGRGLPDEKYTRTLPPTNKAEVEWEVELPPGKHELETLVRGEYSSDLSNTLQVDNPLPAKDKPILYCLSIGINYDWDPKLKAQLGLKAAEGDATRFLKAIQDNCAGPNNRFQKVVPTPLVGKAATRKAVVDALHNFRRQGARPGDLVVLYFAGHGVIDGKGSDRGFYLLTADAEPNNIPKTALGSAELREALSSRSLPCSVFLVFDACQSGGGLKNFIPAGDEVGRSLAYDDEASVTVLAAAMAHQAAAEDPNGGRLTRALTKVLQAGPGTFYDPVEKVMNVQHAYVKVLDMVSTESKGKQTPVLLAPWTRPPLVLRKVP